MTFFDLSKRDQIKTDIIFSKLYNYEIYKTRIISDLKQF